MKEQIETNMKEYISAKYISFMYRKLQKYVTNKLKPYNITSSEYPYIVLLYENDNVLSQDNLHKLSHIDRAAITRAIASLEKKGYVIKKPSETNSRYFVISLTEKALEIKSEIIDILKEWNTSLYKSIPTKDANIISNSLKQMHESAKEK